MERNGSSKVRRDFASLLRAVATTLVVTLVVLLSPVAFGTGHATTLTCGSVLKAGSQWLGGLGVDVRFNSGPATDSCTHRYFLDPAHPASQRGWGWQCVELINRLYWNRGWITQQWVGNGYQMYGTAPSNLARRLEGSVDFLSPGDVVVFNTSFFNGFGHVAVVEDFAGGSGHLLSQNVGTSFEWPVTLSGGTISVPGRAVPSQITGVVHHPGAAPQGPSFVSLMNRGSDKCVDATGASTIWGTKLQLYTCNNTNAQKFQLQPTSGGYYRINYRRDPNMVFDVTGASLLDGARAELWGWNGGANQQWQLVSEGSGYYHLVALNSGKCLDVTNAASADGTPLQQYHCNGTGAQSFALNGDLPYAVHGTSGAGLRERTGATTTSSIIRTLPEGQAIVITCQVRSSSAVNGSYIWDRLSDGTNGFVTDYYTTTPVFNGFSPGIPRC